MLGTESFLSMAGRTSSSIMSDMERPLRRISASKSVRPYWMFSSRRSFLNHCFIFVRADELLASCSQSRLGPGALLEVRTSTMSPF